MLKNKKILLGVTGGIAVYKAVDLAGKLTKAGAIVKTILTKNAMEFITPLTFRSITHQTVSHLLFNPDAPIEHISLAGWADFIVIAPATANIIGKMANGIADDLLSTTLVAATCPILFVPAMNVHMFENKIVQSNIEKLKASGYYVMIPDTGHLACGYEGRGRFPDSASIKEYIEVLSSYGQDLINKKILVTAGASRETIDPMRYISNHSTGKMGIAIAKSAHIRGAEVKLIHGHIEEQCPYYLDHSLEENAQSMYDSIMTNEKEYNIIIMCAAVADYTPHNPSEQKIKKKASLTLELSRTKDILFELGKQKTDKQILIGFAAESENINENALIKLEQKNLDLIVANSLVFAGKDDNEVTFITKETQNSHSGTKFEIANDLLNQIKELS